MGFTVFKWVVKGRLWEKNKILREKQGVYKALVVVVHVLVKQRKECKDQKKKNNNKKQPNKKIQSGDRAGYVTYRYKCNEIPCGILAGGEKYGHLIKLVFFLM